MITIPSHLRCRCGRRSAGRPGRRAGCRTEGRSGGCGRASPGSGGRRWRCWPWAGSACAAAARSRLHQTQRERQELRPVCLTDSQTFRLLNYSVTFLISWPLGQGRKNCLCSLNHLYELICDKLQSVALILFTAFFFNCISTVQMFSFCVLLCFYCTVVLQCLVKLFVSMIIVINNSHPNI